MYPASRVAVAAVMTCALLGLLALCGGSGAESESEESTQAPALDERLEATRRAMGVSPCPGSSVDPPAALRTTPRYESIVAPHRD